MTSNGMATKYCRVCNDVALGFNFNGLSCESCKAFFRRNALLEKPFICKKTMNCPIDKSTRKRCKYCRLKKCFDIGMRKELIVEYKNNSNSSSTTEPEVNPRASGNVLQVNQDGNLRYTPRPPNRCPIDLPPVETALLNTIKDAMKREFNDDHPLTIVGTVTVMNDGFNLCGYYVKSICKFCKHIDGFNALPVADQVLMLKSFFFDVCAARFAFTYDANIDGFPLAANATLDRSVIFPLQVLDQWKKENIVPMFRKFHSTVSKEMENDTNIRDLVIVQCLFNKKNTSRLEFLRYQFFIYNRLLKMYLAQKYRNEAKMERKYAALMAILSEGESLRKIIEEIYAAMPVSEIQPVIAELYGLL